MSWTATRCSSRSLREKFDTTSPHGRLIITVLMALNQFEREQVAERTRLNMRARAERGLFSGGTIPLGYRKDPERNGHLLLDESEAQLVRSAFDAYLKTGSMRKTAQQLKQRGLQRPARINSAGKLRPAAFLTREHLRHMLKNPSYAGFKEINRVNRVLSDEEMEALPEVDRYRVVEAVWEPIITREVWGRTQELIREGDRTKTNVTQRYKHHFVLSGLVHCVGCGTPLHGASAKQQTYFYYQHPSGTFSEGCPRRRWTADVVEKSVLSRLERLAEDEALLDLVVAQANERLAAGLPSLERELYAAREALSRRQAENRALVSRLVGMPQDAVPQSFWDIAKEKEAEIQATREEIQRLERKQEDLEAARLSADDFRDALQNLVQVYEQLQPIEQSRLLACLIDRIVLDDEKATMWLMGEQGQLVNPSAESSPRGVTSSPCWT